MGWFQPHLDELKTFHRHARELFLACVLALMALVVLSLAVVRARSSERTRQSLRVTPTAQEEHESLPMPPGHLDRG